MVRYTVFWFIEKTFCTKKNRVSTDHPRKHFIGVSGKNNRLFDNPRLLKLSDTMPLKWIYIKETAVIASRPAVLIQIKPPIVYHGRRGQKITFRFKKNMARYGHHLDVSIKKRFFARMNNCSRKL